jgi:membrane-associated phospholipid phosphatase
MYFLFIPKYIFKAQEHTILIVIFLGTYIFPLILLFLLKKFGMIKSYYMDTIEERKFPTILFISLTYIIGNWLFKSSIVDILAMFYFGYGLGLIISYILLHFKAKISLHALAIGGLIGFSICFSYYYKINLLLLLTALFVLSGLISTSRLILKAHKLNEIVMGYMVGVLSQIIIFFLYYII